MDIRRMAWKCTQPLIPRPLLRGMLKRRFFAARHWNNMHWGVFDSFGAANDFVRQHRETPRFEIDQRQWLDERQALLPHDYPVLFWLDRALRAQAPSQPVRLFDLGGSVGVSYMAFKPVLALPAQIQWQVCELPETAALGAQIAVERGHAQLSFTSDMGKLDGTHILFSAGTIQYIETPLEQQLAALARRPAHVIINRLPLTGRPGFVTLQNSGRAICPYRIANTHQFLEGMTSAGYRLVDRWRCLQNSTAIPMHPELTLPYFHGFYFVREDAALKRS